MKLNVKIKRLNEGAVIPKYAHDHDAGFDLVAMEDVVIEPGATKLVSTGLAFSIPSGYEMQIRPRSGITLRTKLRVQLGTVDSGYIGEVKVIVDNIAQPKCFDIVRFYGIDGYMTDDILKGMSGQPDFTYIIRKGDRIAQAVLAPVETAHFVDADELEESMRGGQGFGSSGVKS